jgi:hydrogenase expression/formation protein HypE
VDDLACPLPTGDSDWRISLAHGEGGRLSRKLIREHILPRLGNPALERLGDAAALFSEGGDASLAFTTDGFTVSPLFFPGGDIGRLAVFGTVNDLAVSGAVPRWLSLGLIIEEGLPLEVLDRVLDGIRAAAKIAQVEIVAGDTKVVPRGTADGIYLTTSGLGRISAFAPEGPQSIQPGDAILVSGPIGRHGAAILCAREKFDFDPPPTSDCGPLTEPIQQLLRSGCSPRALRDATRGGVAAVLHEWAEASGASATLLEEQLPIREPVRAVCELLGLDPLHLANEGTFVLATPAALVERTLGVLRLFESTRDAAVIGRIGPPRRTAVSIVRATGREVAVEDPAGAPLPRIC